MLKFISRFFYNIFHAVRSNYPVKDKIKVILMYIYMISKYMTFGKIVDIKKEKIFNFKVHTLDYGDLLSLYEEIFVKGVYWFKTEKIDPLILDCGANIGIATLFFKWLYPKSKIYCFEPDKKAFGLLKKNIEVNKLDNVTLYNVAISDRKGELNLFVNRKCPASFVSTKFERISFDEKARNKVKVRAISFSSFIKNKKIDFIKMDIEGAEIEVIQDLNKKNVLKNMEETVIEYHHELGKHLPELGSFLEIFEKNGFKYQIDAKCTPLASKNKYQNILIYCYKK